MSYRPILSRLAFALNPQAREAFCLLLPKTLSEKIAPPDGKRLPETWEIALWAALANPDAGEKAEGAVAADAEDDAIPGLVVLCALLLSSTDQYAVAGELLYNLPLHLQAPTVHHNLTRSALSCLRDVRPDERRLIEWVRSHSDGEEHWGVQQASRIMRSVAHPQAMKRLLDQLGEIDRSSALVLQQHLYELADLLELSDRDLQLVLSSESTEQIALSLMGIPEDEREGFLQHISARRQRLVHEETERFAEATAEEIETAQQAMLSTARLLYSRRRITTYMGALGNRKSVVAEGEAEETEETEREKPSKQPRVQVEERKRPSLRALFAGGGGLLLILGGGVLLWQSMAVEKDQAASTRGKPWVVGDLMERPMAASATESSGERGYGTEKEGLVVEGEYQIADRFIATPGDTTGQSERVLFLRVGNVKAHLVADNIVVQSPLVQIRGRAGAKFSVRVVLDATTYVRVEEQTVEVSDVKNPANSLLLRAGDEHTFAPRNSW